MQTGYSIKASHTFRLLFTVFKDAAKVVESDESAAHRSMTIGIKIPCEHLQAKLLGEEKGEKK